MLKFIYMNRKKVPVPVPVKNLYEAILWVEKHLMRDGYSITRVTLDDQDLEILDEGDTQLKGFQLDGSSKLEVQIDSAQDMSIQTIDAIRSLASILERGLKQLAVNCWQSEEDSAKKVELGSTFEDLELIIDMISHVEVLVETRVSITNIQLIRNNVSNILDHIKEAELNAQRKMVAKILLKKLEPTLGELNHELSMLQNSVFEAFAEKKEVSVKVG